MNPNLKFILFLLIAFIIGFGSSWIINTKKPTIEVDKHFYENHKYDSLLGMLNNKIKDQDKNYLDLLNRISKTDSLLNTIDKKGNETKNNFHRSNLSLWNDSVLRANNISK